MTPGNKKFWRIFSMILPGLMWADGVDYNAIKVVFDNCGLSPHIRELYQAQCVEIIGVIFKIRAAKAG